MRLPHPAADANILINSCRLAAQQYTYTYQEPIPVEQLVRALCDQKQVRTRLRCLIFSPFAINHSWSRMLCDQKQVRIHF